MKIIGAITGTPSMSKEEADIFLENRLNLQFGTIDAQGDPNIGPVWSNYDKNIEKILILTPKTSKKIHNILKRATSYFSLDDVNFPYKGAKGKSIAMIVEDLSRTIPEAEKIYMKYLGTLDHPIPKMILDSVQKKTCDH